MNYSDLSQSEKDFLIGCCLGDGTLTAVGKNKNSVMLSLRHGIQQKEYLVYKAEAVNKILNRNCKVSEYQVWDKRTEKYYQGCAYQVTVKEVLQPIRKMLYLDKEKQFTESLLNQLSLQALALWWMDDGNLVVAKRPTAKGVITKGARVGRLNVYRPLAETNAVGEWVKTLTGASYHSEQDGKSNYYRLRYHATELVKIVQQIAQYIIPSLKYKIDLQYKVSNANGLLLSEVNPNAICKFENIPSLDKWAWNEWTKLAKELRIPYYRSKSKSQLREEILKLYSNG